MLGALSFGSLLVSMATGIHEYVVAALVVLGWLAWRYLPAERRKLRWMGFDSKDAWLEARDVRRKRLGSRVYEQLRDSALATIRENNRLDGVKRPSRPPTVSMIESTVEFELALRGAAMVRGIDAGLRRPGGEGRDAVFEKRLQVRAYDYLHRNDPARKEQGPSSQRRSTRGALLKFPATVVRRLRH